MTYCDSQYTKIPKPTATYTDVPKPVVSYTVVEKSTSPAYTIIVQPCLELLAILTESAIEILHEDSRVMVREG